MAAAEHGVCSMAALASPRAAAASQQTAAARPKLRCLGYLRQLSAATIAGKTQQCQRVQKLFEHKGQIEPGCFNNMFHSFGDCYRTLQTPALALKQNSPKQGCHILQKQ